MAIGELNPEPGLSAGGSGHTPRRRATDNQAQRSESDRLATIQPPITALRLITLTVGVLLAAPDIVDGRRATIAWAVVIAGYAIARALHPITSFGSLLDAVRIAGEVGLHVLAVDATGHWRSPFVLSLVTAVVVAGFARGFGFASMVAFTSAVSVAVPYGFADEVSVRLATRESIAWSSVLFTVSIIAAYARSLFGVATANDDELARLEQANALLDELQRISRLLPASLDVNRVVAETVERISSRIPAQHLAVMLLGEDGRFSVAASIGARVSSPCGRDALPAPARSALESGRITQLEDRGGFEPRSRSGVYAPLLARGRVIGVIALESDEADRFGVHHQGVLGAICEPAAVAIDNAVRFAQLRASATTEERTRIARDLHDRIGQSLAYLAFELDRLTDRAANSEFGRDLATLRSDVRNVVTEVRETLQDLRTDVTEEVDIARAARAYTARISDRSGIAVTVSGAFERRPSLRIEQEMWRIAQEALNNVERHSMASKAQVTFSNRGARIALSVSDNGIGFHPEHAARPDSLGLRGMGERSESIGAFLNIRSAPNAGTIVTCEVPFS